MDDLLGVFSELAFTIFYRHICITMLCWLLMIVAALIGMWDAVRYARIAV